MNRNLFAALFVFSGSCDALWGYTKVPTLENNCQVGGVICKAHEVCSLETEQCEQQPPILVAAKPQVIFSNGNDQVAISGSGFSPDTQILIDDQPVSMLIINSSQEAVFKTPAKKTPQGWGTSPAKIEVRSGGKSVTRSDLISWASSVAQFNPAIISDIVPMGNPATIQLGDVNGDGKKDIVTRSGTSGEFYAAQGNGDGTFKAAIKSSTGSTTSGHFILLDVDQDTKSDLVYWSAVPGQFYYSINRGDGVFMPQTPLAISPSFPANYLLGSADLNGDSKPDLIAANYSSLSSLSVQASSNGRLTMPINQKLITTKESASRFPLFSDFNNDQKIDFLLCSENGGISVFHGNGFGDFSVAQTFPGSPSSYGFAIADFNNDSYPDIVTSNYISGEIVFFRNLAGQGFEPISMQNKATTAVFIVATDLNGDKNSDILVFDRSLNNPSGYAFMGYGNGTFASPVQSIKTTFPMLIDSRYEDINNDGRMDAAFINYSDKNAYIIINSLK